MSPKSSSYSLAVHAAVLLAVFSTTRIRDNHQIIRSLTHQITPLIFDLPPGDGSGGGGDRSDEPASKGVPPPFSDEQLVPPQVVIRNPEPKLEAPPTVLGPPMPVAMVALQQIGDPLGVIGPPSNGPGSGGGIGPGNGTGIGTGEGPGAGPGKAAGLPYRPGAGVTLPILISSIEPEYTDEARKARHQGTVVLYVIVEPDGHVSRARLVRPVGLGLDEKALEAVRQWRFRPGMKDGQPVPVAAAIEVTFRLL